MVISRRTSNVYTGTDPIESVTAESSSWDIEKIAAYSSVGLAVLILLIVLIRHRTKKKKEAKVMEERVIKTEEEASKPLPPADMTQAIQNLETTIIDLKADEIRKALDQEKKEEEQSDQHYRKH